MHPASAYILPLDIVFKLIHATKKVPLTKYNPSKRSEKIYRLYVDRITLSGKKIPYLSRATVFKLMKTMGKSKGVSCYIECEHKKQIVPIYCEFLSDASIRIMMDLQMSLELDVITDLILENVNPVLLALKKD